MIRMEEVEELVTYALVTGRVKYARPTSLLLIAGTEHGKTETLAQFRDLPGVVNASDITYAGLVDMLPDFRTKKYRHLIIQDFVTPLSRRKEYVEPLVQLLMKLIEDGVDNLPVMHAKFKTPTRIHGGLISGITRRVFWKHYDHWCETGFFRRIIPVTFSHSEETKELIGDYIASQMSDETPSIDLALPDDGEVWLDPKLAKLFKKVARQMARHLTRGDDGIEGYTLQQRMQTLAKAKALYEGREACEQEDVFRIIELLQEYANFNYKPI